MENLLWLGILSEFIITFEPGFYNLSFTLSMGNNLTFYGAKAGIDARSRSYVGLENSSYAECGDPSETTIFSNQFEAITIYNNNNVIFDGFTFT